MTDTIDQGLIDAFESLQNQFTVFSDKVLAFEQGKKQIFEKIVSLARTLSFDVYVGIVEDKGKILYKVSEIKESFNPLKGDKFFFSVEEAEEEGFTISK